MARFHQQREDRLIAAYVRVAERMDRLEIERQAIRDELAKLVKIHPGSSRCTLVRIGETRVRGYTRGAYQFVRVK